MMCLLTQAVNELSNTIDLPSTLIRAEQLFKRFQRTVEAVDRKNHFPVPSNVRQRKPIEAPKEPYQGASSARAGARTTAGAEAQGPSHTKTPSTSDVSAEAQAQEKVISPELRDLLRRDVFYKLDKVEVKEHGGGVGS
jgi:hypothetical protein